MSDPLIINRQSGGQIAEAVAPIRAFPSAAIDDRYGGMTLRDWFAGQALAGILAANAPCGEEADKIMAVSSYMMADAMIAEREKGGAK